VVSGEGQNVQPARMSDRQARRGPEHVRDPAACAGPRRSARRPAGRRQLHSTLDRRGHIRRLCCRVPRLVRSNRSGIDLSLMIVCRRSSAAARRSSSVGGRASSKTRIPCDHTQRHHSSASGRRPGPRGKQHRAHGYRGREAAVGAPAQVAAPVGVLSGATFGRQFFSCSQPSQCMVTKSCKQ
jgi:hypothetical protein